jgi:hypothetical protein
MPRTSPEGVAAGSVPATGTSRTRFAGPGARWNQLSAGRKPSTSIVTDWANLSADKEVRRDVRREDRLAAAARKMEGFCDQRALPVRQPADGHVVRRRAEAEGVGRVEEGAEEVGRR